MTGQDCLSARKQYAMARPRTLDKEEIRRLTDLVEVVSAHVALKGVGKKLRGVCPFHAEKTASFYVDPDKGLWHCFGCKAGGDVFRFVELISGMSFVEAAQWLARRLGGEYRQQSTRQTSESQRQAAVNTEAAAFFRRVLQADEGRVARDYLERRGIPAEAVIRFGLGYAPKDWERLVSFLRDRGYSLKEILGSGLCIARNSGGAYDRFRNRLLFPITDMQERVVAFGGRALAPEDEPKYLNSPETPLFQKGSMLYGLPWAARAMASRERAIIVEGYFDLLRCHLAGFEETVATLGTALTPQHLELLRRRQVDRLYLAFDADPAGIQAALRSRDVAAVAGMQMLAVRLAQGHDPDTFISEYGAEAMEQALADAVPLLEVVLESVLARHERLPESQRLNLLTEAAAILSGVGDRVERDYYISWVAERFCGSRRENYAKVEQILLSQIHGRPSAGRGHAGRRLPDGGAVETLTSQVSGLAPHVRLERQVVCALLAEPALLVERPDLVQADDFIDGTYRKAVEVMLSVARAGTPPAGEPLMAACREDSALSSLIAELALSPTPWMDRNDVEKLVERLQSQQMVRRKRDLDALLAKEEDEVRRRQLQAEIIALARRRSQQVGRREVGE